MTSVIRNPAPPHPTPVSPVNAQTVALQGNREITLRKSRNRWRHESCDRRPARSAKASKASRTSGAHQARLGAWSVDSTMILASTSGFQLSVDVVDRDVQLIADLLRVDHWSFDQQVRHPVHARPSCGGW
ncbi:MAG: hypothetical protein QOE41_348 [Mycobacterium sp.]|nr:hypothetical protein [Mycobacterium sp.]